MQNEPVVGVSTVGSGYVLHKSMFHFQWGFPRCEARAIGNTEDVGIDGNSGFTKGRVQYDVRSFAADSGQGLQRRACAWHAAAMAVDQKPRRIENIHGFGVVKPDSFDVALKPVKSKSHYSLWGVRHLEQTGRGLVDARIRGLGR